MEVEGWNPYCPFAGGYSESAPDFCDIDNDNDLDILVGSGYVTYVENIGSSQQPNFISNRIQLFDDSGNWVFGTHVA